MIILKIHIIYKDDKLIDETIPNYLKYDGILSIADSAAITMMKKLNIEKIVSFDSDSGKTEFVRIGWIRNMLIST